MKETSKRDPEKGFKTSSLDVVRSSTLLSEFVFVGLSIATAYGLVRLSCAMSISGSAALWLSNGLHTAAIIVSSRHVRAVVPVGFLIVNCLGLLSKFDFQTAAILSAVHTGEALCVSALLYPVYKAKGFQSIKFLAVFLPTAFTATLLGSICRAFLISSNAPTTQTIPNLLLMDWLATALGYLLIVPPTIGGHESLPWTNTAATASCAVLSIIISFVAQRAQVYHSSLLAAFLQLGMSLTGACLASSFGASAVGICGIVSNLGFLFLFPNSNDAAENLFETIQAALYLHTPLQAVALIIAFPMMNPFAEALLISTKKLSEMVAERLSITTKPTIVQELRVPEQASEDSGELDYLRLACKKIHAPLVKISELSKTGKLKQDAAMKAIAQQVDIALAQIEDILFVQKLDAGTIVTKLTSVTVSEIIGMPVSHAQLVFKRRRIQFDQHCDSNGERVLVDVPIFQKALLNMMIGPLDHLAIAPERIYLELKCLPDSQTEETPPQVHHKVTLTIYNSSIHQTQDAKSLFSDYPVKADPTGKLQSLGQTLSISRKLVQLLGSKLEIATIDDATWKMFFTLSCERSATVPPKIFSEMECASSSSRFKTLSLMFPSRSSKCNNPGGGGGGGGGDTISRSKSENTNDTNSLHHSRGFIAAYQSVEKFKNSGSMDSAAQDDAQSQSSKRSNASVDSRKSALSSLRRSLSTKNSVFFKKQVHYEDGIGNAGRESEGQSKDAISGSTEDGIQSTSSAAAAAPGKKLVQMGDTERVSVSRQVSTNSLSLKVPSMSNHRGPTVSRAPSVRKTGDAFSSGLVQAPITAEDTDASELYNTPSVDAPILNVVEAESIVVGTVESGVNSSPVSRRNSDRSLKRHSTGSTNQKLITVSPVLVARNLKMREALESFMKPEESAVQNSVEAQPTSSDLPLNSDSRSPSSSGHDDMIHSILSRPRTSDDWKQGKVLIVDDSSIFRRILRGILVSLSTKIEVIEVSSGEEALLVCREFSLSLIFLDFEMNGMNGDEVLRHLRDNGDQTSVILVTSTTIPRDSLIRQAVAEVVLKPVSKDVISTLVKKFNGVPATLSGRNSVRTSVQERGMPSATAILPETRKSPIGKVPESPTEETYTSLKRKSGLENASNKTRDENATSLSLKRQSALETASNTYPGTDKLALIVDDSGVNRSVLAKILNKTGFFHDVVEVSNGHDAIRLCAMKQFSIIFMDLEMPGMNGEEAAARMQSARVEAPIVAVTSNFVRGNDGHTLKSVGIKKIVMKPFDRATVNEICRHLLGLDDPHTGLKETPKTAKTGLGSMFSKDKQMDNPQTIKHELSASSRESNVDRRSKDGFWFSFAFTATAYPISYGLVKLSMQLRTESIPLFWTVNGFHVGIFVAAHPRVRPLVPIGFIVAMFFGLYEIHGSYSKAIQTSLFHALESLLISGVLYAVNHSCELTGARGLGCFIFSSVTVSVASALCRSLILHSTDPITEFHAKSLLIDSSADILGLLILSPLMASITQKEVLGLLQSSPKAKMNFFVPILMAACSAIVAYVLYTLLGTDSALLSTYCTMALAYIAGYFGGSAGLSFTSFAGVTTNLWFCFNSATITSSYNSGHLLILHVHSILQILGLIINHLTRETESYSRKAVQAVEMNAKKAAVDNDALRLDLQESQKNQHVKSRYLAYICEQFHQPLLSVLQWCESSKIVKPDPDMFDTMAPVYSSVGHLLSIVDDVLSYIQLEYGAMKLQPVSVNFLRVVNSTVSCAKEAFQKQDISFEHQIGNVPDMIVADPIRLQQCLLNVLISVSEYCKSGSQLILQTASHSGNDPSAAFSSKDFISKRDKPMAFVEINTTFTSEYLTQEDIDSIFVPYIVRYNSDKKQQGSGLSMPIAGKIIELMGGSISVEFLKDQECCISVLIPTAPQKLHHKMIRSSLYEASVSATFYSKSSNKSVSSIRSAMSASAGVVSNPRVLLSTSTAKLDPFSRAKESGYGGTQQSPAKANATPPRTSVSRPSTHSSEVVAEYLCGTIVIVDDSSIFRQILSKMLKSFSDQFQVHELQNGVECMALVQRVSCTMIFMDLEMPKMNGEECCASLRLNGVTCPIIAISGQSISPEAGYHLKNIVGFTEIHPKPISKDLLLALLKQYNRGRARTSLLSPPSLNSNLASKAGSPMTFPSSPDGFYKVPGLFDSLDRSEDDSGGSSDHKLAKDFLPPSGLPDGSTLKTLFARNQSEQQGGYSSVRDNENGSAEDIFGVSSHVAVDVLPNNEYHNAESELSLRRQHEESEEFDREAVKYRRINVLVVDDSLINRSILVRVLDKLG
ncbi:hypothetical protein CcCBS67573_g09077 [Chytriomyces confervae]|uniref:Response regulatory domain-containing protein n=1 Tax=Chytriomyces confervae TaxID=246404 RepID=A0A507E674_9FUNG|nr:hypothetical protein CcCBS67573_g09077 [Chytriomyces confervae]